MSNVIWPADAPAPGVPVPQPVAGGARKYHGAVATGYDAKRQESPKWHEEDRLVREYLSDIPSGDWVLDCPIGTGRFIPFYEEKGFQVVGIDLSEDMLQEASKKITKPKQFRLQQGNALVLKRDPKSVDVAVMVRLTRWLTPEERDRALREMQVVARKRVVFTARVRNHPYAYPYEEIESSLMDGWTIARDEPAGEENYRVIALEPME